jgi:hypothetical protein
MGGFGAARAFGSGPAQTAELKSCPNSGRMTASLHRLRGALDLSPENPKSEIGKYTRLASDVLTGFFVKSNCNQS